MTVIYLRVNAAAVTCGMHVVVVSTALRGLWQVECKHAEPKDSTSSSQLMGDVATAAAAGGAMILAQAADGSVGLVPASALHASASLRQGNMAVGPAAAAGGLGLLSSTDLSAAATATYRAHDLLQPSLLSAGQYSGPSGIISAAVHL